VNLAAIVAIAALAALPLLSQGYALVLAIDIFVFALFAASLHFILGAGGMVSFGHAAYLGLGAYGAGLLLLKAGWPMEAALAAAPLAGAALAALVGWFCVRLSGVYLAMLTLALAQIAWSVVYQWDALTGGSNGLVGIWPAAWLGSRPAFYWLTLALVAAALWLLRRALFAPFGYALRAGRDSPLRSDAIGIDVRRIQWIAFAAAGGAAGLAGGLFAFSKGSISPDSTLAVSRSIDALVMVLLGGVQTLTGPLAGAAAFIWLQDAIVRNTDYWRAILGAAILAIVLAFPQGIVGALRARFGPREDRA
jgi:branched-chain amino acid transport system permease protein